MSLPQLFSRERRWRWAERTSYVMLFATTVLVGVELGFWWILLTNLVVLGSGVILDVIRHRRPPKDGAST